jgi:cobalt-zinc-cadmium efflux system membrane fusion protein
MFRSAALTFVCASALLVSCKEASSAPAQPATASSGDPESIKVPPNSNKLNFIKIETVAQSDAAPNVNLTGRVTFDEDHTQRVSSPIDGRVTSLVVRLGDKVKANQSLLELSSPHVGQLQSDAQKAAQDLSVAEKGMDRAHKLQADGAISDKEVAQVDADYKKAKSELGRTSAQLRSLGVSASDPAVAVALRAQIPGTIVERNVLVGQEVRGDESAPLLTISNLATVWVVADVYEQDLKLVQQGDTVDVTVSAYPGEKFSGNVAHIGDVVDPTSRTVKITCVVPNADGRLKPEMFAKAALSGASDAKVIVIPSKAVLSDSEHTRVIVQTPDEQFHARIVTVGPEADGKVRVLAGLQPGERVVTEGALFLKEDIDDQ